MMGAAPRTTGESGPTPQCGVRHCAPDRQGAYDELMTQHQVDLAIIGAGSGNTLLTDYWDDKQVAIAEKGPFGGTCLNVGCIPTKMFVRPAELARTPVEAQRLNVSLPEGSADWPAIRDRIFSRIDPIAQNGYEYRDQSPNVRVIAEEVTLDGTHGFRTAQGTSISAEQLVIAAGSRAVIPDIEGCDLPGVHTSDTVMRLERLPERIVIVGGGFIACEFAAIFSGLGSRTTQLIRRQHLMRHMDTEIRDAFNAEAPKYWNVERNTETQRITKNADGTLEVHTSAGTHTADIVLVATGRKPNTDLIGAQQAGLDLHQDGRLVVDEYQRVLRGGQPVPGLYALGDICSTEQLKHVANYEARVVAHNLQHPHALRANSNRAVPAAVFTHPELAQIGLTEQEAVQRIGRQNVSTKTQMVGDTAYGWALEDQTGLFKVVADRRDGSILGAHVMGYQASNLIQPVVMAMNLGIDAYTAARGQYWIHPSLMEVTENALLGLDVPQGQDAPL